LLTQVPPDGRKTANISFAVAGRTPEPEYHRLFQKAMPVKTELTSL